MDILSSFSLETFTSLLVISFGAVILHTILRELGAPSYLLPLVWVRAAGLGLERGYRALGALLGALQVLVFKMLRPIWSNFLRALESVGRFLRRCFTLLYDFLEFLWRALDSLCRWIEWCCENAFDLMWRFVSNVWRAITTSALEVIDAVRPWFHFGAFGDEWAATLNGYWDAIGLGAFASLSKVDLILNALVGVCVFLVAHDTLSLVVAGIIGTLAFTLLAHRSLRALFVVAFFGGFVAYFMMKRFIAVNIRESVMIDID